MNSESMNNEEARRLLDKYLQGTCTPEEKALVERWYLHQSAKEQSPDYNGDFSKEEQEIWQGIRREAGLGQRSTHLRRWITAAAAVLILAGVGFYFYNIRQPGGQASADARGVSDVLPGGNRAVLTLADGSKIKLDIAKNGTIATEGDVLIKKSDSGLLVYNAVRESNSQTDALPSYNTITTPSGGQYQVILPDGTKVWLNAASSIRFPTAFGSNERSVSVTGEAYFEVTRNAQKPFKVHAREAVVQVLGTEFNVMAYDDEHAVRTTLVEGSVKVSTGKSSDLLRPGQQAEVDGGKIGISKANIEEAVSWKNGYFYFKDTDIRTVMRQISRWYDVDVKYDGQVPGTVFTGKMYRSVNVSKVLEILTYFKVNYKIEQAGSNAAGRKTIVITNQ